MTAKTAAALNTQADTDLADNTAGDISAGDVRTLVKDIIDSTGNTTDNPVLAFGEATSANFRDNTANKILTTDQVWGAGAEVTLTDAATIAVDLDSGINFVVTLGGNRTLGNPTNEKVGQSGYIRVVQDGTGTRTLAYASDYEFAGGTAPVVSAGAAEESLLFYVVLATDRVFISSALDIQ
jgi:hypothetical protein